MATVLEFNAALLPRGPFDLSASYETLNFVESGGSGYVCLQPCSGIPVTNTAYWFKFVHKGDPGTPFTYADLTAEQKAELAHDATIAAQAAQAAAEQAAQKFATIKASIDAIDPQSTEGSIQTLAAKQGVLDAELGQLGPKIDEMPINSTVVAQQADLEIIDPNGYILARFANGHFITKNFDSSAIKFDNYVMDKFVGKKFAFIGDSITTYSGWLPSYISGYDGASYVTYYPHGDVDSVEQTWWYMGLTLLGITPSNENTNVCAWSGCRVTGDSTSISSASAGCSTKRISDLSIRGWIPDIVVVFISCNDWAGNVALGSWQISDALPAEGTISEARAAYALMLSKIRAAYPKARIFCCTLLDDYRRDVTSGWPSNNTSGITTTQWNNNIKEIAEAFGCDIIDLHNCGLNYSNIASMAVDTGLHPNSEGMTFMARRFAADLIAKY